MHSVVSFKMVRGTQLNIELLPCSNAIDLTFRTIYTIVVFFLFESSASRFGGFSPDRLFLRDRRREKKGAGRKPPTPKNRLFLIMGNFIK